MKWLADCQCLLCTSYCTSQLLSTHGLFQLAKIDLLNQSESLSTACKPQQQNVCRIQQGLLADDCEQKRQGGADYELIATVSHHGRTPASGHYTADVRQPDGEWLRFDDDYVSHISQTQVLLQNTETYLLFYEMKPKPSKATIS